MISPLQAGEHGITTQEVEAYFQQVQEEATELVRAEELHRMVEWIDEHFADGAVLQANMSVVHGEERKGFLSMTLDKDDDWTQIVQRNGERLQTGLMTCTGELRF